MSEGGNMNEKPEEEMAVILQKHKMWLRSEEGGERADLRGADLSHADLSQVDLSHADLSEANLNWANLSGADLHMANLSLAHLRMADLSGANLSWATLTYADLCEAKLNYADLRGANLSYADLYEADLHKANLSKADLSWANLQDLQGALTIMPIGSRGDMLVAVRHDGSPNLKTGCFWGDIGAFRAALMLTHPDPTSHHRRCYEAALNLIEVWAEI